MFYTRGTELETASLLQTFKSTLINNFELCHRGCEITQRFWFLWNWKIIAIELFFPSVKDPEKPQPVESCQTFLALKNIDHSTNLKEADFSFHRSGLSLNCHQNIAYRKETTANGLTFLLYTRLRFTSGRHLVQAGCACLVRPSAVLEWLTDSILGRSSGKIKGGWQPLPPLPPTGVLNVCMSVLIHF